MYAVLHVSYAEPENIVLLGVLSKTYCTYVSPNINAYISMSILVFQVTLWYCTVSVLMN